MLKEQPCEKNPSNCKASKCAPSTEGQLSFHQSVLELNCSEISQGFFGILAVLESRLAASPMNK